MRNSRWLVGRFSKKPGKQQLLPEGKRVTWSLPPQLAAIPELRLAPQEPKTFLFLSLSSSLSLPLFNVYHYSGSSLVVYEERGPFCCCCLPLPVSGPTPSIFFREASPRGKNILPSSLFNLCASEGRLYIALVFIIASMTHTHTHKSTRAHIHTHAQSYTLSLTLSLSL